MEKTTNSAGAVEVQFDCGPIRNDQYLCIGVVSKVDSDPDDNCCVSGKSSHSVANLIAQAPAMYEMLERVASLRDKLSGGELIDWVIDNTDDIEELLAKARGEQ